MSKFIKVTISEGLDGVRYINEDKIIYMRPFASKVAGYESFNAVVSLDGQEDCSFYAYETIEQIMEMMNGLK